MIPEPLARFGRHSGSTLIARDTTTTRVGIEIALAVIISKNPAYFITASGRHGFESRKHSAAIAVVTTVLRKRFHCGPFAMRPWLSSISIPT